MMSHKSDYAATPACGQPNDVQGNGEATCSASASCAHEDNWGEKLRQIEHDMRMLKAVLNSPQKRIDIQSGLSTLEAELLKRRISYPGAHEQTLVRLLCAFDPSLDLRKGWMTWLRGGFKACLIPVIFVGRLWLNRQAPDQLQKKAAPTLSWRQSLTFVFSMVVVVIAMVKLAGGCVNRASRTGGDL